MDAPPGLESTAWCWKINPFFNGSVLKRTPSLCGAETCQNLSFSWSMDYIPFYQSKKIASCTSKYLKKTQRLTQYIVVVYFSIVMLIWLHDPLENDPHRFFCRSNPGSKSKNWRFLVFFGSHGIIMINGE